MTYQELLDKTIHNEEKFDCTFFLDALDALQIGETLWYKATDGLIMFRKEDDLILFYFFLQDGNTHYTYYNDEHVREFYEQIKNEEETFFFIPGMKMNVQIFH